MKIKSLWTLFFFVILTVLACSQPEIHLIDEQISGLFINEISGERAKDYVTEISQYHRIEGAYENTDYEKAVSYVMSVLTEAGVKDIQLHTYLSDGFKTYGTWLSHVGFRVSSAKLHLVQPYQSKWCDYAEIALCLMPYSNGSGVDEAEVAYMRKGTSDEDYEGKDVKGKIVFVDRGNAVAVMRQAVMKKGALGIVMGFSGNKERGKFPDLVELNRLYVTGEETESSTWGFSLSKAQTDSLKELVQSDQKVMMRAEVDAETFSGNMPIISAAIKGSKYPDQEIIYMAHLDHYKPGANDNASGSAGLMEIATTLTVLVKENKIPRPLRTMRFLWIPEWEGTVAYLENNRETARKGIIGINMDMIGEDLEKCKTHLFITSTPLSRPSFLNALVGYHVKFVDKSNIETKSGSDSKFKYEIIGYFGESDHMLFNDAQIGVPSTMFVHLTDRFWHTSYDTPDKVDPTELKRTMLLGLLVGWTTANYNENDISKMVEITHQNLEQKIDDYSREYRLRLRASDENNLHSNYRNINSYYDLLLENGVKSLESVLVNVPNQKPDSSFQAIEHLLNKQINQEKQKITDRYNSLCKKKGITPERAAISDLEQECSQIIPVRKIDQSLNYWITVDVMDNKGVRKFIRYDIAWEMLNFTDGKNNLLQIRDAVSAQFGEIKIEHVKALFEGLRERDFVSF